MTMPARSGVIQGSLANSVDSFKVCNSWVRCCNAPGCPQTHSLPIFCLQCTVYNAQLTCVACSLTSHPSGVDRLCACAALCLSLDIH